MSFPTKVKSLLFALLAGFVMVVTGLVPRGWGEATSTQNALALAAAALLTLAATANVAFLRRQTGEQ
jgi:hypothetical protein